MLFCVDFNWTLIPRINKELLLLLLLLLSSISFFCLGAIVTIKVSENGPPDKIYHENDLKVYQGDGDASDGE